MSACSVEGCGQTHYARGWCRSHYMRFWATGSVNATNPLQRKSRIGAGPEHYNNVVRVAETDDCLRWPFAYNSNGRAVMKVAGRQVRVHRYVCEDIHGKAPSMRHHAAHLCGNRWCINHRHLRWATPSENNMDKLLHGTHNRGERHNLARLSEDQVRCIRKMHGAISRRELADKFGVSIGHIKTIQRNASWAWLGTEAV